MAYIIAEIAQAHDGSLGNALAFIEACAAAGASAVKFQCHDGDPNDKLPDCDLPQDADRQAYWHRTGFDDWGWDALHTKAKACGVDFGVTPFSVESLERVAGLCEFVKIARGTWWLHDKIVATGKLVIATVDGKPGVDAYGKKLIGLDAFVGAGISCHEPGIERAKQAIRDGAEIVEKHVCWDRRQFGPDSKYSITIDELAELCRA